jgi:hypothetical protein
MLVGILVGSLVGMFVGIFVGVAVGIFVTPGDNALRRAYAPTARACIP